MTSNEKLVIKNVDTMNMDELAAHLMNITKGSRFKISKLTLEVRNKL